MTVVRTRTAPRPGPHRIVAWYLLLFGGTVLVAMVPMQRAMHRDLERDITDDIEHEVERLRLAAAEFAGEADTTPDDITTALLTDHIAGLVPGDEMVVLGLHGNGVVAAAPRSVGREIATPTRVTGWSQAADVEWGTIDDPAGAYRWLRVPVGDRSVFVVALPLEDRRARFATARAVLLGASVAALALGGLVPAALRRTATRSVAPPALDFIDYRDPGGWEDEGPVMAVPPVVLSLRLVDAAELTEDIVGRARSRHPQRHWQHAGSADGDLVCDVDRIHHALARLAEHAVEHGRPDEVIGIGSRDVDRGGGVCFWVSGHPPGPVDDPIIGGIVDAHAGQLSVEAGTGDTAVVSVWVPRLPQRQ